jgi:hypothetical protein
MAFSGIFQFRETRRESEVSFDRHFQADEGSF